MGKTISFVMNKGGVGKTVTATSIAAILSQKLGPRRILLVDGDHQGSCSITFGLDPDRFPVTLAEVLYGEATAEEAIVPLEDGLDLLPANDDLATLDFRVFAKPRKYPSPFRLLTDSLAPVREKYDYILIDSPPSLSLLQGNIITASDEILLVFQCEHLAVRGCQKIIETINLFKEQHNPQVKIAGIIPTMLDNRTGISRAVLDSARAYFAVSDIPVFKTVIPRSVRFSNAPAYRGKPAVLTDKTNPKVGAYYNLVTEVFGVE